MTTPFLLVTILFVIVSVAMVLIILVQRPAGGGLAGAFGGAGGGGSETVFGGRVGDALTWATVVGFVLYLSIAISLNLLESTTPLTAADQSAPTMERVPGTAPETPAMPVDPGPQRITPIITPVDPPTGDATEVLEDREPDGILKDPEPAEGGENDGEF